MCRRGNGRELAKAGACRLGCGAVPWEQTGTKQGWVGVVFGYPTVFESFRGAIEEPLSHISHQEVPCLREEPAECAYPRAAVTKYHRSGLTQGELVRSQLWRSGVWNQGVGGRCGLLLEALGRIGPGLWGWQASACGCMAPTSASIVAWPSAVRLCLCVP